MRFALKLLAVLVVGTALGLAATWLSVRWFSPSRIGDGPWKTNLLAGSAQSGPYWRAAVATHALFALNCTESAYYTADTDSDGGKLDGRCRYEMAGPEPQARWWSITAYGPDDYLIANPAHRYSVSKMTVAREGDNTIRVEVGGEAGAGNWIPTGSGPFSLTLRFYNPGSDVVTNPAHVALPAIRKMACT
jgi:hypothetical protein